MKKLLIGILLIAMLTPSALADTVIIDVDMSGDADVTIDNHGDGEFILIYNGRDILQELLDAQKSINDFQKTIIYHSTQQQFYETQQQLNELSYELGEINEYLFNLTEDLDGLLGDLYRRLAFTMHAIGINPGTSSVAQELIAGNATVAEYIDDLLDRVSTLELIIDEMGYSINALYQQDIELSDQISALTTQQGDILQVITTLSQRLEDGEGKIETLETELSKLQLTYDDLHIFNGALAEDNQALEQRIAELEEDAGLMVIQLWGLILAFGLIAVCLASQGLLKLKA